MQDSLSPPRRRLVRALLALGFLTFSMTARPAFALVITVADVGRNWQRAFGTATTGTVSQAELVELTNAAGDYWESRIHDPFTMNLQVGFSASLTHVATASALGGKITGGDGLIGVSPVDPFFADATPFDNDEYGERVIAFRDLGAGPLNTGFGFGGGVGEVAAGQDLFTILLHEIGHKVGAFSGDFVVPSPLPFAGSVIPSALPTSRTHLGLPESLMSPHAGWVPPFVGKRTLPSDADIRTVATLGGFRDVTLNHLNPVSEPGTLALFSAMCACCLALRRRWRGAAGSGVRLEARTRYPESGESPLPPGSRA